MIVVQANNMTRMNSYKQSSHTDNVENSGRKLVYLCYTSRMNHLEGT